MERKDPKEKKCAICGKDIYAGEEWAYKRREKSERTKWFCSYKCMRAWDAKHGQKETRPAGMPADLDAPAPKEPVSRAVLARALAKEIKNGGSVIAYLTAEGYKNPYEAYNSVRHYCETKAPELAEVLKPLKDLPKGPQKKTGRPRKYQATVEKVEEVPPVLQAPVTCIQHVTPVEIQEAAMVPLTLSGGVDYQLKVDEAMKQEKGIDRVTAEEIKRAVQEVETQTKMTAEEMMKANKVYTRDYVLRIVDEAALKCQEEKCFRWGSDQLDQQMFHDARSNAVGVGVMKLRKEIRRMLGAEDDG